MGRVISFFRRKGSQAARFPTGIVIDKTARDGAEFIAEAASRIRAPGKYRNETFHQAVQRQCLTAGQLREREDHLYRQHCFFAGAALLSLLCCAWSSSPVAMINAAIITAVFATKAWSIGFRRWQLEERSLGAVSDFMLRGGGIYRGLVPLVKV